MDVTGELRDEIAGAHRHALLDTKNKINPRPTVYKYFSASANNYPAIEALNKLYKDYAGRVSASVIESCPISSLKLSIPISYRGDVNDLISMPRSQHYSRLRRSILHYAEVSVFRTARLLSPTVQRH